MLSKSCLVLNHVFFFVSPPASKCLAFRISSHGLQDFPGHFEDFRIQEWTSMVFIHRTSIFNTGFSTGSDLGVPSRINKNERILRLVITLLSKR